MSWAKIFGLLAGVFISGIIFAIIKGGIAGKAGEVKGWFAQILKPVKDKKTWPTVAIFLGISALVGAIVVALTVMPEEIRGRLSTPTAGLIFLITVAILAFATKDKESGVGAFLTSLTTIILVATLGLLAYSWRPISSSRANATERRSNTPSRVT